MSDLESGLKEAVLSASRPKPHLVESRPMTAPEVFAALAALQEKVLALHGEMGTLSTLLAGGPAPEVSSIKHDDPRTIFDEMGSWLIRITHIVNAIESEVDRSLGAVR